jgi:hypothetical protein
MRGTSISCLHEDRCSCGSVPCGDVPVECPAEFKPNAQSVVSLGMSSS